MSSWTSEELRQLDRASEVAVAGRRADGSARTLVTVWHVVVDGELYLRSVKGPAGHWYRGVVRTFEGFLSWNGDEREVAFTLDSDKDDSVDRAYVLKYGNGSATRAITNNLSKETTLRVEPR